MKICFVRSTLYQGLCVGYLYARSEKDSARPPSYVLRLFIINARARARANYNKRDSARSNPWERHINRGSSKFSARYLPRWQRRSANSRRTRRCTGSRSRGFPRRRPARRRDRRRWSTRRTGTFAAAGFRNRKARSYPAPTATPLRTVRAEKWKC